MSKGVLYSGIDWLDFSFKGEVRSDLIEFFDEGKQCAQDNSDVPVFHDACGIEWAVLGKGSRGYSYHLSSDFGLIRIATMTPAIAERKRPSVCITAYPLGIITHGYKQAAEICAEAASSLGDLTDGNLSRLDLCCDLQGWKPTTAEMDDGMVTRARKDIRWRNQGDDETFNYGKKPIGLSVYNKRADIEVKGKYWVSELWKAADIYDPEADVFRVEYKLRRDVLREMSIDSFDQALGHLAGIWNYCLGWASLRIPGADSHRDRWNIHPAWELLGTVQFPGTTVKRARAIQGRESLQRIGVKISNLLASVGAELGTSTRSGCFEELSEVFEWYDNRRGTTFHDDIVRQAIKRGKG